ncbi:3-hydroxyacyl-ACP dehydratase FabZ [Thermanaerovibrio acidaminovorans]|jgi:3-hydroxyacyl-[acyl-carrier-protein] dehydratase|uniref:3-hydroxyacyl-[acyl-carrier-protein] dehydratase FabZ n=1 Tax=Thermanaerovibrio acidaminovorans (strain ATCC 49978 / DSM 6589 / Su883) TaxID=525903 RepID=D1B681_THEAS|nr:3-hydroxyacyl-ACP dehydratase FabZ [Thermanaerovibrio acidaminovorans]ACZ19522.1 beta-hydroxyacyl-(acyl-carrier-protein) dehydratase FabZ [Thermanaerovibrio acidaminovorans DSM 6589]
MDILKIMEFLPHRYPFLLVDRILEVGEDRVVGLKNVTVNEPFFQGHFPSEPVMPGVLILEAMGQVAACLVSRVPGLEGMTAFLTSVEDAKFRRPVRPGDQLITEARMLKFRGRMGKVSVTGTVDGELAAQAVLGFALSSNLTKGGD